MIELIETLIAIHKFGAMTRAANYLRLTQSAISKRIAALEHQCGKRLIVYRGKTAILTKEALNIVEKAGPLIIELKEVIANAPNTQIQTYRIGVSESILSTWGGAWILKALNSCQFNLEWHTHRGPLVIDKVHAGEYQLGICAGNISSNYSSLVREELLQEEIVLFGPKNLFKRGPNFLTVEKTSSTWKEIRTLLHQANFNPSIHLESFLSAAQLAKSGLGLAAVPKGVADLFKGQFEVISFRPKVFRTIYLISRKSTYNFDNEISIFKNKLKEEGKKMALKL